MGGTTGSLSHSRSARVLQVLSAVLLIAGTITYWTTATTAGASPTSAFEINDANIVDSPSGAPFDWSALFETVGAGVTGPVTPTSVSGFEARSFAADPISSDPLPSVDGEPCDANKKGDLTVFTSNGSDKIDDPLNTWSYASGSVPDAKDDLTNVYAASKKDGTDTIFYYALERSKTNGSSHVDFEFFRSAVGLQQDVKAGVPQEDSSGCPKGHFSGTRSINDILVSMDFDNGGVVGTPIVRYWDGNSYELLPGAATNVGFFQNGSGSIDCGDWNCRDATGATISTLPANAFVEGFLNVSGAFNSAPGCYSTFVAKTRSSSSEQSELKDFAMGNFNTCDARISITPSGINPVGTNHTFTAHVDSNASGTFAPVSGALVTGALTGVGSFVGGNTCTTNASGDCTLTITSAAAGVSTVNVSTTVNVSGAQIFRSTATAPGPGGSGPATKNWVDAYIKVTPNDVNPVNEQHAFTVEYGVLGGGAPGLTMPTPTITPTVSPAGYTTVGNTCASPTQLPSQNVWQCTVTINSATAAVYTATASASTTVTMTGGVPSSVTLSRSTSTGNHGPGGNTGATKTYVDARILISPDGLNQVDNPTTPTIEDAHTMTATVQTKDGDGAWTNASAGTAVTFSLSGVGSFVGGTSTCQTSGVTGQCTVQINSTTAGTSTVSASTTVAVHGLSVVRATNTAVNTAAGGSGDVVKKWVDASITVVETATNEVNDDHVFTITVTPHVPTGASVTAVSITPTVTPVPGISPTTTCGSNVAVVGGTATCTYTINSSTPGVFDVDASTTVDFSWSGFSQSVTRSTGTYPGPSGNQGATKTYVDARVTIGLDGVNAVGDPHTVTGTAEYNDGTGWKPAAGKTITFAITSDTAASFFVGGVTTCVAGADGTCSVSIRSNTPGITWVKASTSYGVGGVTLNRTTAVDGATDPDNLRKEWVAATISITPTAVNTVNEPHQFTVVVTGTAEDATITIGTVGTTVTPTPSTPGTLSCGAQQATATGATKTCTITINSTTSGVFTANATATVTIGGVVFNLSTNGQGGNSGAAVKTYVDARISLTPDGVNEINDPHPVTAIVEVNNGTNGWQPAGAGLTVTLTEDGPGDIPATCTTAANGQCTVNLTSSAPGVSSVNASVTVDVLGETITRTTGTALNTTAGGSGALTKRWIDGSISITPSAVNPVGAEHVFTITATAVPSGAGSPSFVISPSVTPAPDSISTTCATPTVVGNTSTCTVTINNNDPGVFTANASVDITVGGVTITRNTDPSDAISAGPAGSGPATKRYVNANIQISPDGINQVGEPHVITAHVNVDNGSGVANAPAGTVIEFTIESGPGSLSAPSCTTIGTTGSCTVTLDSPDVGVTIVSAKSTVKIEGIDITVTTNGAGANSDDLEKAWVDGFIKVTPDDVNEVNDAHAFNVEYTVLAPAGTTVTLGSLTADVTPNPNTQETSCTPVRSGNTWTCTVTINSSVTGVFDIDASGSATVTDSTIPGASETVPRSTTGTSGPGGNDGATKTYVDARVSVTPGGLNAVDDEHTVTATVETKDGNGSWVKAPAGTQVAFTRTGAGSFVGGIDDCTTVGVSGECSIKILSAVAGSTEVGAATTVTVHGVSITRTSGDAENLAAGGSGPITKEWVDGSITIVETATNEVNDDHVFTITAYAHVPDPANGDETVTFESITPTVDPTLTPPGQTSSTTCVPGSWTVAADGLSVTCTYTINSDTPGVFDVDATVVMKIDNDDYDAVTLTRSTGPAADADPGPEGNDGATKTFVDARITIGPDGVNAVGDPHTVTGTATKNAGTGGWVPAVGETITFAITQGPGAFTNGLSTITCVAGANGTCQVSFASDEPGVTWVSASTQYNVGGVSLSRTTAESGATDADNVRKEWVDAHMTIAPTAVNTVNEAHVFDIDVTAESSGAAIDIGTVTFDVEPDPDSQVLACGAQTPSQSGATKSCTLTINDSSAGIHTANASVTVTIGGVLFNLTTNGQDGNSGAAVKTYVDARVSLNPDGVNEVGDPHDVTAIVEVNDGNGWDPAPAGVTVELTESGPGSIPATCTTDATGTCTVSLISDDAGVSTVHASVTVEVLGEVITRETSTALNTAAGGSGDLTKRWVDGLVAVTPDGVNPVGEAHTFTVTVTAMPSGAGTPSFAITPLVTPTPGTMTSTCATPTVNGDTATCTVTINNDSAGVFTINVTADITVGDLTIRRSTDADVAPAGPGGSGQAVKTYVDAVVSIGLDGVNEVGDPHTVSGHVDVVAGNTKSSAPAGTTITFAIVSGPGALSSTSCTTVGATGSCSVTLTSSAAGVTVVSASTSVDVLGVTLDRTTTGTAGNSGNLTKRWVDGFITIGPSAVNPLNEPHDFTVTATMVPSGASPVAFESITTSVSPTPGTMTSTCDKPTVNGNTATCTLTINSAVAGTFVANATVKATVGGAAVTRSTDSSVAIAGPGGSGPATKQYVAPAVVPTVLGEVLRRTGGDFGRVIVLGATLLTLGSALLLASRRRLV